MWPLLLHITSTVDVAVILVSRVAMWPLLETTSKVASVWRVSKLSLKRQFWRPFGSASFEGSYVASPSVRTAGVLRLGINRGRILPRFFSVLRRRSEGSYVASRVHRRLDERTVL